MATIDSYQVTSKNNKNVFVKKRAFDHIVLVYYLVTMFINIQSIATRVEPDTRLKRVSGTDKALLPSTSIIRVIRVNICARIE